MTKRFDDCARNEMQSQTRLFNELEYFQTPVREMIVREVSPKFARPYISTHHYTHTFPDSTKHVYAGFYGEQLAGVAVWGMGSSKAQYAYLIPEIKQGQYLELTRLWSADGMPRNTESKLISTSIKMLPRQYKLLLSFADPSRNHVGIIYQASNWIYCGESNPGKQLVTQDGTEQHARLLGIYKMRHPELQNKTNHEIMAEYGWEYKNTSGKHRYCYLRGTKKEIKQMSLQIEPKTMPYPKLIIPPCRMEEST